VFKTLHTSVLNYKALLHREIISKVFSALLILKSLIAGLNIPYYISFYLSQKYYFSMQNKFKINFKFYSDL